ncbi:MAG: beta-lactamase superfamily hydrolase, partial [Phycisphaerales bacterium]|nr:beta-lactamase superfamily hydrolase [Phycisphaerales bacterium]
MSLDLCILASGSAGNCSVVRSPRGLLLIDGGLGQRSIDARLRAAGCRGVRADDLAGVLLTHLDRDHLSTHFLAWAARRRLPIFCHAAKVQELLATARRWAADAPVPNVFGFGDDPFEPVDGITVDPVPLAHDAEGSHAFILGARERAPGSAARRIGFAT